jgi:hypothetical protein
VGCFINFVDIGGSVNSDYKYWLNTRPICPHCDHEIRDVWDYEFPDRDGFQTDFDCPKCEKKVYLEINLELKYSTSKVGPE